MGLLPLLLMLLVHRHFAPALRTEVANWRFWFRIPVPGWHRWKLLNFSTCRAHSLPSPFQVLSYPALPFHLSIIVLQWPQEVVGFHQQPWTTSWRRGLLRRSLSLELHPAEGRGSWGGEGLRREGASTGFFSSPYSEPNKFQLLKWCWWPFNGVVYSRPRPSCALQNRHLVRYQGRGGTRWLWMVRACLEYTLKSSFRAQCTISLKSGSVESQ